MWCAPSSKMSELNFKNELKLKSGVDQVKKSGAELMGNRRSQFCI
jgi:hypothetical protein